MDKIVFSASKHKITVDSEGEATLILKIPQSDAQAALQIPVQQSLTVAVVVNP